MPSGFIDISVQQGDWVDIPIRLATQEDDEAPIVYPDVTDWTFEAKLRIKEDTSSSEVMAVEVIPSDDPEFPATDGWIRVQGPDHAQYPIPTVSFFHLRQTGPDLPSPQTWLSKTRFVPRKDVVGS